MRIIDTEHNWFWQQGYHDGLEGLRAVAPDETRHSFQRSDYFAGYDAGSDDCETRRETCEHCEAPATVDAHEDAPFPVPPYWLCSACNEAAWDREQERASEESP